MQSARVQASFPCFPKLARVALGHCFLPNDAAGGPAMTRLGGPARHGAVGVARVGGFQLPHAVGQVRLLVKRDGSAVRPRL